MKISSNTAKSYSGLVGRISEGFACGLGGMLLIGVPGVLIANCWAWSYQEALRHGIITPEMAVPIWDRFFALPRQQTGALLILAPIIFGFVYGWYRGTRIRRAALG